MKYQVIGSPEQVALIDFGGDMVNAKLACNPTNFSNINPATGQPFEALVAGGIIFDTKTEAADFVHRCESALAYVSGQRGAWIIPTFVVREINGHLARKLAKERRASAN